jgi:hypothetical protein
MILTALLIGLILASASVRILREYVPAAIGVG